MNRMATCLFKFCYDGGLIDRFSRGYFALVAPYHIFLPKTITPRKVFVFSRSRTENEEIFRSSVFSPNVGKYGREKH